MKVYINGEMVEEKDAKVSVFDSGFLLGDGLFETMRAYNGTIFVLDSHLGRLMGAARVLELRNLPDKPELADACNQTVKTNGLSEARVRLTVTRGLPDASVPTVVVTAVPFEGYNEELYEGGMSAITLPGYRCSNSLLSAIKSISYLSSILARREAVASNSDEAILINEHGRITEGSFTNIFAVKERELYTPPIKEGLLPGITREFIIEVASKAGYRVHQHKMPVAKIFDFDELFLTNSLMEIMPLTKVDGNLIGNGKPGPVTENLARLYKENLPVKL